MGNESLVGIRQEDGTVAHFAAVWGGGSFSKIEDKSRIVVTEVGADLFTLLGLDAVPQADIDALAEEFRQL